MKKAELKEMIAEAIKKSDVTYVNKLDKSEIDDYAIDIANAIADKLVVKRKMIVSGSIDDCPDYSIHHVDEDVSEFVNHAEDDGDGFNKDDLVTTLEFNLIEDLEKYARIQELLSVIPHCKTRKEAEEIQDEINEIEEDL